MTQFADVEDFKVRFSRATAKFVRYESQLREQYARQGGASDNTELLERPTRRYLVDALLEALGWDVGNPEHVAEEARSQSGGGSNLYFDYLGISPETRVPVLLVEAKGFDVPLPKAPYDRYPNASEMATLLATAVGELKSGTKKLAVTSSWATFLKDMHQYVQSLDDDGRASLRRAVISAGRWLIVFKEPISTFISPDKVSAENIDCYVDFDEIQAGADQVHGCLARSRLLDSVPLTLDVQEALRTFRRGVLSVSSRAILVATSETGALRARYPIRNIYPAIVVSVAGRVHAIVDYNHVIRERGQDESPQDFEERISAGGSKLESRLRTSIGLEFQLAGVDAFQGFPAARPSRAQRDALMRPMVYNDHDETLESMSDTLFVVRSGVENAHFEYLVATGSSWFYKTQSRQSQDCAYHSLANARRDGVGAAGASRNVQAIDSFTVDGEAHHCANADLIASRHERCHLRPIESQLCCQACIFLRQCWAEKVSDLPCILLPQ